MDQGVITNPVRDLGLTMDNCGGQSYDGAVNLAGRYAGALTLIQHQFCQNHFIFGQIYFGGNRSHKFLDPPLIVIYIRP